MLTPTRWRRNDRWVGRGGSDVRTGAAAVGLTWTNCSWDGETEPRWWKQTLKVDGKVHEVVVGEGTRERGSR